MHDGSYACVHTLDLGLTSHPKDEDRSLHLSWLPGLEPATFGLKVQRTTNCANRAPKILTATFFFFVFFCFFVFLFSPAKLAPGANGLPNTKGLTHF